ncbi:MAG: phosphatase PAP2 family protein [Acidobacteriota bacterium]
MLEDGGETGQLVMSAPEAKIQRFPVWKWLLALAVCALLAALAFHYVDLPLAKAVAGWMGSTKGLATGFASNILLGIEGTIALTLALLRITRGRLSPLGEATGLACLTSICAYAVNDHALKPFFGVPDPVAVWLGTPHAFHLFGGSAGGSFPSGHMVIAGAFAGVFMRLYRRTVGMFSALLLIAAVLLVVGEWHFVSDVIAGTFVGVGAGILAGELWLAHAN